MWPWCWRLQSHKHEQKNRLMAESVCPALVRERPGRAGPVDSWAGYPIWGPGALPWFDWQVAGNVQDQARGWMLGGHPKSSLKENEHESLMRVSRSTSPHGLSVEGSRQARPGAGGECAGSAAGPCWGDPAPSPSKLCGLGEMPQLPWQSCSSQQGIITALLSTGC